jgi:hypothetical protein
MTVNINLSGVFEKIKSGYPFNSSWDVNNAFLVVSEAVANGCRCRNRNRKNDGI